MRKFYTTLIALFVTTMLWGQITERIDLNDKEFYKYNNLIKNTKADLLKSPDFYKKMDSIMDYDLNEYNALVLSDKAIFYYDESGNDTLENWYSKDESSGEWDLSEIRRFDYDINGGLTLMSFTGWNDDSFEWETWLKYEIERDVNGCMDSAYMYEWDNVEDDWLTIMKFDFNCDIEGNLLYEIGIFWDEENSIWLYGYKEEYTYDLDGNVTSMIEYEYDQENSLWIHDEKYEFFLDAYGNDTLEIGYEWDNVGTQWEIEEKERVEYLYDNRGNILEKIQIRWGEWNSYTWTNSYKNEYEYDTIGNPENVHFSPIEFEDLYFKRGIPVKSSFYSWNNNRWDKEDSDIYYYTIIDGPTVEISTENLNPGDSEFDVTITFSEKVSGFAENDIIVTNGLVKDAVVNTSDSIIFTTTISPGSEYQVLITVPEYVATDIDGNYNNDAILLVNESAGTIIKSIPANQFSIYPNPASNYLFINVEENLINSKIEIINLEGSVVYSNFIQESFNTFNINELPNGVYIIRIIKAKNSISSKLVIE